MKKHITNMLPIILLISVTITVQALTLDKNYKIMIPVHPIPAEITAANELTKYLLAVTDIKYPVQTASQQIPDNKRILVGPSQIVKQLLPNVNFSKLTADEIIIKTVGNDLILAGGRPRGTLYAVYTFLEEQVGCRWWTSDESFIPNTKQLVLDKLDIRYAPQFIYREALYRDIIRHPQFASRLKCNGNAENIPPRFGGHLSILGWCHTFGQLLPPEKYFTAHPEWYSELNGKHNTEYKKTQLCLTNRSMRKELINNSLHWLEQHPAAGFISVTQNDNFNFCQCEKCKEFVKKHGNQSDLLLDCVNEVAAAIEKKYPQVLVQTLAYQYTRTPPKTVRPRHNVVIELCSIECNFLKPLTAPVNRKFQSNLNKWSCIAPQLFIWNYVTNFTNFLLPHPNWDGLSADLLNFAKHKVIGVFEQGDAYSTVGDWVAMRAWVISHLLWNPHADFKVLMNEFLSGYYGSAAPSLKQYLQLLQTAAEKSDVALGCYMGSVSWLAPRDIAAAWQLMNAAQDAIKDQPPIYAQRLEKVKVSLLMATLSLRLTSTGKPATPKESQSQLQQLDKIIRKYHTTHYGEGKKWSDYYAVLEQQLKNPPPTVPELCRNRKPQDWIDLQETDFTLFCPIVTDSAASNRQAASIAGNTHGWLIQCQIPGSSTILNGNPWHCYAMVRCETTLTNNVIATVGMYDTKSQITSPIKKISGTMIRGSQYRLLDLGTHSLNGNKTFWFSCCNHPLGEVKSFNVDRLFLIRGNGKKEK